jgi:single-stranded DNA-specific DHH superfamily exonuclease
MNIGVQKIKQTLFRGSKNATDNLTKLTPGLSFLKFQKFQYNKRLTITKENINKNKKVIEDVFKMIDTTDFKVLALTMQSDMFHENLFQNLSKKI